MRKYQVGGTGASAGTDQFPRIINGLLGTKMKIVTGYPGGNDNLAECDPIRICDFLVWSVGKKYKRRD